MAKHRILIVEDEILISDTIKRYLESEGYEVCGQAISYQEAVALYASTQPHLVLIDIYLHGSLTGVDLANYICQQERVVPFIYLTAQIDPQNIAQAKRTKPVGYLPKPIRKETLLTTVEISLYNYHESLKDESTIQVSVGETNHLIVIRDIIFLRANHVYVHLLLTDGQKITVRKSLREMLALLPQESFVQTHRSYAVNLYLLKSWDNQGIYFANFTVPLSRLHKKNLEEKLEKLIIQNK